MEVLDAGGYDNSQIFYAVGNITGSHFAPHNVRENVRRGFGEVFYELVVFWVTRFGLYLDTINFTVGNFRLFGLLVKGEHDV